MRIDEVPQDKRAFRDGDQLHKLVYATDKDGRYTGIQSAGWEAENFATKQAWDEIENALSEARERIGKGEASPIAFFMIKNLMDETLLAKYTGLWKWQVKRHMKPGVFAKLKEEVLAKYAQVFNITAEELINFEKK